MTAHETHQDAKREPWGGHTPLKIPPPPMDGGDPTTILVCAICKTTEWPCETAARMDAESSRSRPGGQETAPPAGVASVPTVDAAAVLASHRAADYCYCASEPHSWHCYECEQVWRGDAETGGCTSVLLARENIALRERAETAERYLHDLTPMGSEYHANPRRCFEYARDSISRHMRMLVEAKAREHAATARVALLEGLLREHEWEGYVGGVAACTACGRAKRDGHAPGCPMGTALADGG